jgi:hypothetical protein
LVDLFLDKLFQLTVPMPALGAATQLNVSDLFAIDHDERPTEAEVGALNERIETVRPWKHAPFQSAVDAVVPPA